MVVVHSDNQMFYNTSKESMVVGGEKYQERDGPDVSSPNNNEDSVPDIRYEGRDVQEMGEEPVHPAETRDGERTREEFECPFCPSKFSWRSALMQHQETEHSNEQMFICDQCDKIFTDPSNLQRHIRTQHSGSRSHSCPECGKTFATSSGLKQHTHIHSSIKPFICEVCLKSYTQFSNLCRHKRMHADCRTQLKCSTCGQMYTTITSLNKHRRFCHSASPLISKHLSPTSMSQALQPPSILPYSPPLIGLPPSALYQASLAQMWNANMQQALIAQSLGKTMLPNPYMLGYPPLSTHAPLYSTLNPGGAADSLHEEHKKLMGQFPSSGLKSAVSADEKDSSKDANDDDEEHSKDDKDLEPQIKRMRVESVSPAASPLRREESQPPSPVIDEHTKFPRFIHKPTVSPTGSHPPRIASPANSLGHQEDGRSAFSPPQVSPSSSTKSTEGKSLHRPTEQPLDLTMQKTPSPIGGLPSPISGLPSPVSPLSGSFTSDRLSHLLESKKRRSFLGFPGYSSQLPSSFDPMYKVKMEQQHLAEHYSRSAITSSLPGLTTFPPANLLGSPQAAFLKYHSLQGGSQFPFGGGVMYPTSSKDMMIRGGKDRYTCKFCGKLFPRSANLTRHLRTHTGEQPYSCKYCDRSFSISSNLQRHVRNIHNKEKPFKCPLCDRCFGQQTNLDRHLKKHDNEQNGEITTTSVRKIDENIEKIGSEKIRDIDGDDKDSSIINPGSPEFLERMVSPSSPQRHSEPAQPLKIQYKIARGRSPLSSSSTCQSPRSSKVDSGLASPSEDEEACEEVPTEARNVESSVDRSEAKLHSYPYITTRPSSWDSQDLHKPKAILT